MCNDLAFDTINIADILSSNTVVTITGLEENSIFAITVTAASATGNSINVSIHSMTTEAGEVLCSIKYINVVP